MYDSKTKKFFCNNCEKEVSSGDKCWTKWTFPPKNNAFQDKSIKALEHQNAPIICLACAKELILKEF